jgi:type IV pilus assembly protein PilQ
MKLVTRFFIGGWIVFQMVFAQGIESQLNRPVTLSYNETPLNVLLRIMAKNYNFNYVISDVGTERVSVKVVNVPLKQALNAILLPIGYHYFVQDSIIVIKQIAASPSDELESFVYICKHRSADYLLGYISPMLSEQGKVVEMGEVKKGEQDQQFRQLTLKPNHQVLLIRDIHNRIRDIQKLLQKVDIPVQQIAIEVKLVERLLGDDKNVGLNWPTKYGVKTKSFEPINQQAGSGGGGGSQQEEYTGWFKDLPAISDNFQWGVIAIEELRAFLQVLAQENKSKIVSNPKITVANNEPAVVNIGTTVPILTIQRAQQGDLVSYEYRDISSYIEVLPVINGDNTLTLTIHPTLQEITGYVGEGDAPVPIVSTRELITKVKIKDGEALVIGGLIKETESRVVNKVFLLGDIPLLGYLFKHSSIKKQKSDLVIIVTPKIMEE